MSQTPHGCGVTLSADATLSRPSPVALLYFPLDRKHLRDLVDAAAQQLRSAGMRIHWTDRPVDAQRMLPLCDAVLGWDLSELQIDGSAKRRPPVTIQMQNSPSKPGLRRGVVVPDYSEIASLAGEHLLAQGHRRFAFVGHPNCRASNELFAGLSNSVGSRTVDRLDFAGNEDESASALLHWLASGPRPVGVLAADDQLGARLLAACQSLDLQVPAEVSVLGVFDDEPRCLLTPQTLSSVDVNGARIGREAAALTLHLLSGHAAPEHPVRVAPIGPITRQSTQSIAVADSLVAQAVEMIRLDPLRLRRVDHIAEHLLVSRRTLERAFATELGWSPAEEIRRAWRDRARHLVGRTDQPLKVVARACGHHCFSKFAIAFKRATGQRPSDFRARYSRQPIPHLNATAQAGPRKSPTLSSSI